MKTLNVFNEEGKHVGYLNWQHAIRLQPVEVNDKWYGGALATDEKMYIITTHRLDEEAVMQALHLLKEEISYERKAYKV